jgi:hypothetical protein
MMSHIKRRQFLQFAGSALTTIGLSQFELFKQGDKYGKVLAQGTPRKLALLVGINSYPQTKRFNNLQGCLNDVELQRQLLIHRFGFNPNDIKTLKDGEATREGILTAFNEHLVKQAKPGDVVVFHFSGHGSRVADPYKISADGLNSTFVPADDNPMAEQGIVNDIMGRNLFLLMSGLKQKTENVTVVLDSCHSGGGTRGNVLTRAVEGGSNLTPCPAELEYQQRLIKDLNINPKDVGKAVATGVVLAASRPEQIAIDYGFPGFHAGAFTYLLTQYLWQQTNSVETVMNSIGRNIRLLSNQVPLFEAKPNSGNEKKPLYFLDKQVAPAEAVITEINGSEATIWLGGIAQDSMEAFGEGATFVTLKNPGSRGGKQTQLELKSRNGLFGTAIVKNGNAQTGALLQEFARAVPSDLKLQIGLDPSLGAEAAAAKSGLEDLNRTEALPFQPGNTPYAKEVHYIFSRMTPTYRQKIKPSPGEEMPAEGSIGLFSPSLELIPGSFDKPGETVPQAIARLKSKLKSLLAARIVKMTLNADSSRLNIEVKMNYLLPGQSGKMVGQAFTPRGCEEPTKCPPLGGRGRRSGEVLTQQLPLGSSIQFEVTNAEKIPLYLGILLVDPSEGIAVLFPNDYQQRPDKDRDLSSQIEAGATRFLPDPAKKEFIITPESTGVGEMLFIASEKPLTNSLLRLASLAKERGNKGGPMDVRGDEAVAVIDDLVIDLSGERKGPLVRVRPVSVSQMATLSISFEVVKQV